MTFELCVMDWTLAAAQKRWECRNCGRVILRNSSDGHPIARCSPPLAMSMFATRAEFEAAKAARKEGES